MDKRTVGVLGGGQLGRMMIEAANRLGVRIAVLDPGIIFILFRTTVLVRQIPFIRILFICKVVPLPQRANCHIFALKGVFKTNKKLES